MSVLALLAALLPQARGGYPAFVWRLEHPGAPVPEAVLEPFGGVNVEGAREAKWARQLGLDFYVGHAPGRDELHLDHGTPWYAELYERFYTERDPRALVRQPCLSEPATHELLHEALERTLAARDGDHGLGLSLGDEVGLTPYGAPLDLCAGTACESGFVEFLRSHPRWARLAPAEDETLPAHDTDTVRRAWTEGETGLVPLWLARREFQHEVVHELLIELADRARAGSTGTPVGPFGQSGRTAFGDVGIERVLPALDFLEVYRLLDSRELLYTLRTPEQRSYLTVFHQADAPHGARWIAWEHWLRGGDGLVLWSDRDLAARPAYLRAMARTVAASRRLRAQLPGWRPEPRGVAVLHAPDSLALSWLRDSLLDGPTWPRRFPSYHNEHGTRELALQAILRLLEDAGHLPGSLPLAQLDEEATARFPLLVAVHMELVTDAELAALTGHLEAGGHLALLGPFATYDGLMRRRTGSGAEALPEGVRSRVLSVQVDHARAIATRGTPLPPELAQLLPSWRPAGAPAVDLRADTLPWLRAMREVDGAWILAALPNAASQADRRELGPVGVEVVVPDGFRLEWLHPEREAGAPAPAKLPPGEPLVVRLRRAP